jgi:hypothetical protein
MAPNPATEGTMRVCGVASSPVLLFTTISVALAMGTAVVLLLAKRADVARWSGALNGVFAAIIVVVAAKGGPQCTRLGMIAASLPFLVSLASLGVSLARSRARTH